MHWLEKIFSQSKLGGLNRRLPSLDVRRANVPASRRGGAPLSSATIPSAALIYGIGSAMVFACVLYFFFTGAWLTSFLLLLPAGALFGFAHLYMKHFG